MTEARCLFYPYNPFDGKVFCRTQPPYPPWEAFALALEWCNHQGSQMTETLNEKEIKSKSLKVILGLQCILLIICMY